MKKENKPISLTSNIIILLDILLAALIVFTAFQLSETSFGKAALTFGIIMLGITTLLAIWRRF